MMLKCHLENNHQGFESMRHELQQRFWILGSETHYGALKVTAFLAENTVQVSMRHLWHTHLAT